MASDKKNLLLISLIGVIAWLPTLNFWFFKAYEATWLTGIAPYNLISLIKGHAFIYYFDQKIFGWNPWGWYLTSLVFHIIAALLLYKFILLLTKNKLASLVSSLFFVVSTSYNDVLTWGSFNSYYPLLLIFIFASLITFLKYKHTNKIYFLILSLVFAFLGFYVRETGIVIIPLLFLLDIVFIKNLKKRDNLIKLIKRQIPFLLIIILFFLLRLFYGGTSGDSADSNVKLQMRFVADGLYLEYAKASLLTFGKLIPPQIIPYEFLNYLRESVTRFIFFDLVKTYFFPIIGLITFSIMGIIIYILRQSKYVKVLMFFFLWVGTFSLFVSLAIPNTPEVLERVYEYNTMRYRYFAFVGTSVFMALFLINLIKKTKLLYFIVFSIVLLNLVLVWKIELDVYANQYRPAKQFYTKFITLFPKLTTNTVFYIYPHAPSLGDYLLEWNTIKGDAYKNLDGEPYRVESQIIAVLNKVKEGKIDLSSVLFLDYSKSQGLIDETSRARNLLLNQEEYNLNIKEPGEDRFESEEFKGPFVEIPYNLKISLNLSDKNEFLGKSPDSKRFRALVDYSIQRNSYLENSKITTAYTMSQREGEPFFHVLPKNLIDGDIGSRSIWIADHWAPWVQVDLGEEKEIVAVSWGSQKDSTRIPASYSVLISKDGKNWGKIIDVKNSSFSERIDVFSEPRLARFVRMEISTTSGGDFVLIDEFEVISKEGSGILSFYKERSKLINDTYNMFNFIENFDDIVYFREKGLNTHWAKLSWETNKTSSQQNNQIKYFPYKIGVIGQEKIVELPELEVYSGTGDFLEKYITSVSLDFGKTPFDLSINSISLLPRIKL